MGYVGYQVEQGNGLSWKILDCLGQDYCQFGSTLLMFDAESHNTFNCESLRSEISNQHSQAISLIVGQQLYWRALFRRNIKLAFILKTKRLLPIKVIAITHQV